MQWSPEVWEWVVPVSCRITYPGGAAAPTEELLLSAALDPVQAGIIVDEADHVCGVQLSHEDWAATMGKVERFTIYAGSDRVTAGYVEMTSHSYTQPEIGILAPLPDGGGLRDVLTIGVAPQPGKEAGLAGKTVSITVFMGRRAR